MDATWKRVERAIAYYDERVRRSLYARSYDQRAADMRDLLIELSQPPMLTQVLTDVELKPGYYLPYQN